MGVGILVGVRKKCTSLKSKGFDVEKERILNKTSNRHLSQFMTSRTSFLQNLLQRSFWKDHEREFVAEYICPDNTNTYFVAEYICRDNTNTYFGVSVIVQQTYSSRSSIHFSCLLNEESQRGYF
jgi:hypothetical protein